MAKADKGFSTKAIRTQADRSGFGEHSVPVYLTSSYAFETAEEAEAKFAGTADGPIYSRYTNPNTDELVAKIAAMEGAEDGLAVASGMASMWVALGALLSQGDHALISKAVFGSTLQITNQILPRYGISCDLVSASDPAAWERALRPNTKLILVETPSNPGLEIVDLAALAATAEKVGAVILVDNTFCSPYLQQPLRFGAHLSCHSTTKYLDGQGRTLGGVIVGSKELIEPIRFFARHTGPALSPFNAWIVSKSLETLAIRMDRHGESALAIARWLETQSVVKAVRYPFLDSHPQATLARRQMKSGGGIVTFDLGSIEAARKVVNRLHMISRSANLGDSRSIVTHPATTTHQKVDEKLRQELGITPGLVRLSVGLEDRDDIISDLAQALNG